MSKLQPPKNYRPAEELVVRHRRKYVTHWRTRGNLFWFIRLVEEVIELGLALAGLHKDEPRHELKQIGSICINWIEYMFESSDE